MRPIAGGHPRLREIPFSTFRTFLYIFWGSVLLYVRRTNPGETGIYWSRNHRSVVLGTTGIIRFDCSVPLILSSGAVLGVDPPLRTTQATSEIPRGRRQIELQIAA